MLKLGKHYLVEYYSCDPLILDDQSSIQGILLDAALKCGATVLEYSFHKFSPQGVSGVVVIAESHISIHTWPEYGYAAVDIFTCGTRVDPWVAYELMKNSLSAKETMVREIERGEINISGKELVKDCDRKDRVSIVK